MKCRKAKNHLADVLTGEARPNIQLEVERHLEGCAECRKAFDAYRGILEAWERRLPISGPRRTASELLLAARMSRPEPTWRDKVAALPVAVRATLGATSAVAVLAIIALLSLAGEESTSTTVNQANMTPDKQSVEEKTRIFDPLLGSQHVYEEMMNEGREEKPRQ